MNMKMRIAVKDDNIERRAEMIQLIRKARPDADVCGCFTDNSGVVPDVLFMNAGQMYETRWLKSEELIPQGQNVVFYSDREQPERMLSALRMRASGFMIAPYTVERIRAELDDLRYFVRND